MANTLLIEKESSGNYAFTLTIDTVVQPTVRNMFNYAMSIGNVLNFKTATGANVILRQNINVSDITLDDGTTVFTNLSIGAFLDKLEEIGFNDWRKGGGTGGGVDDFEQLNDTFSFFGQDGKVPVVDEQQSKLVPVTFYNYNKVTQMSDMPNTIIGGKMLVSKANGSGHEYKDIPTIPQPFLTSVGSFNYADLATQTTALDVVINIPLKLTNDGLGTETDLSKSPYGVGSMLDTANGQIDLSGLSVGDIVNFTLFSNLITTSSNQAYRYEVVFGVGSGNEVTKQMTDSHKKTSGIVYQSQFLNFVVENEDFKNFPAEVYVISDGNGTIVINSFFFSVIRKNINVIEFEEPNYPAEEFKFLQKGYGNTLPYPSIEIGDIFCGWTNDGTIRYSEAIYNGGLLNDSDNFTPLVQTLI